jgi:hypothetical protein
MNGSSIDKYNMNKIDSSYKSFMPRQTYNGRIDISPNENGTPTFIQDKIKNKEKTNYANATQHMIEKSLLSVSFFSLENINILQNTLRSRVFEMSQQKYKIDSQEDDQLKIVMRSIYLQYGLNQNDDISKHVTELNDKVLNYVVPQVYGEVVSYMKYKEDISTIPEPMKRPSLPFIDKTLELNNFF